MKIKSIIKVLKHCLANHDFEVYEGRISYTTYHEQITTRTQRSEIHDGYETTTTVGKFSYWRIDN